MKTECTIPPKPRQQCTPRIYSETEKKVIKLFAQIIVNQTLRDAKGRSSIS